MRTASLILLCVVATLPLQAQSPREAEVFSGTRMVRPAKIVPKATAAAEVPIETVTLKATWEGGYTDQLSYWTSTTSNTVATVDNEYTMVFTNLADDRVFARVRNEWGESNLAHWPPYPFDRLTIRCPGRQQFAIQSSTDLKRWTHFANVTNSITVFFTGPRLFFRAAGATNAIVTTAFNPLNL